MYQGYTLLCLFFNGFLLLQKKKGIPLGKKSWIKTCCMLVGSNGFELLSCATMEWTQGDHGSSMFYFRWMLVLQILVAFVCL